MSFDRGFFNPKRSFSGNLWVSGVSHVEYWRLHHLSFLALFGLCICRHGKMREKTV